MLRSRPNRQQRPSSGSGESSSQYGSGNSPMVMSSANDDYDPYGKPSTTSKQKPQSRGMFGFGTSSGGGAIKKAPNNQYGGGGYGGNSGYGQNNYGAPSNQPNNNFNNRNTNNVWDKKSIGSTIKGNKSPATSFPTLIVSICIIVLLALSGMTMHYKRAISRTQHELNIVNKRIKHHERFKQKEQPELAYEDERDEDDEDNNSNEEDAARELAQLATTLSELQAQNSKWKGRNGSLNTDIKSQLSEIDHLKTKQIPGYQTQISKMKEALVTAQNEGKRLKEEFVKAHGKGSGSQIVPGGPGAAVVQKRTLESMESIDDYEEYVDDRENALWDKIDVLVAKLERESRREAVEWFGEGPHTVELEIEYPQYKEELELADDWPRVRGTFRIEMAPLSLMPIAVNLFMQQVHHKLWNGCSFVINAMHILQAGPHRFSNNGKYDANVPELLNRFVNSRLDKMPFQEYNDEFPHDKYTVGFAGRPGGPDFYINKINNSVNHGPGGQTHHDLHEEADPCFGRLVGGMEILSDLGRVPVDYDRGALLLYPVVIVDSRVVATRDEGEKKEDGNDQGQGDQQQKNEQGSDGGGFNAPNPGP